ncbi:MAG: hypothetical protein AAF617_04100 [Bacteroidota bacterium]
MALVLTFVFIGCTGDQETSISNDADAAKIILPVLDKDWVEIGYIKNGEPVITFDTKKALTALSSNMEKYGDINETYTSVYVANIDGHYNLFFEGETYRTAFYVKAIQTNSKLATSTSAATATTLVATRKITCTTSDCAHESTGCAVKYDRENNDLPYCSPCNNGGKCTKTDVSNAAAVSAGVF